MIVKFLRKFVFSSGSDCNDGSGHGEHNAEPGPAAATAKNGQIFILWGHSLWCYTNTHCDGRRGASRSWIGGEDEWWHATNVGFGWQHQFSLWWICWNTGLVTPAHWAPVTRIIIHSSPGSQHSTFLQATTCRFVTAACLWLLKHPWFLRTFYAWI